MSSTPDTAATIARPSRDVPASIWAGRILTGVVIAFLVPDAGLKLIAPEAAAANSPETGWSRDAGTMRLLGIILLIPTLLYAWPRTAVLGAILATGYLGGAIATHLRIGSPLLTHTLFGVYLGLALWGGLWLRMPDLRALIPVRTKD